MTEIRLFLFVVVSVFAVSLSAQTPVKLSKDYKVVYSQGFSKEKDLKDFEFTDRDRWLVSQNGKSGKCLKCLGKGNYVSAHAGPEIMAVLKGYEWTDFVMELDVMQNGKDYSLLDICILFGIKDADHFYYAQLASRADRKSHNVFVMKGDKPQRIGTCHNKGVIWGINKWHHVRVERLQATKTVRVFLNDELVLETDSDPFEPGLIGFGSFDDACKVDNLRIWAKEYNEVSTTTPFFAR
ncbi:hypothetical protein DMA11_14285 [Marinilabiliaceae bacterium JC017]|nr:hypothetical protein DMA11_14285 [Marinilabiliaceae bacterium JC017]